MKHLTSRSLILFLALFLIFHSERSVAGHTFKPGSIVSSKGDTIRGELAVQGDFSSSKSCIFRTNAKADAQTFKPFDIRGYAFDAGKHYESAVLPESGDSLFLRFVLDGNIDLLSREDYRSFTYYYIRKDTLPLVNLYYIDRPVSSIFADTDRVITNYKTTLYPYTDDCPALKGQVRLVRTPSYTELYKVIHRYQRLMNPDEPLKHYVNRNKKHPFLEVGYEMTASMHKSITFFYPIPMLPKFVFLGVGYDNYYGIPLQVRLQVPIAFLRPEIGAGIAWNPGDPILNVNKQRTAGLTAMIGPFAIGAKYTYHYVDWTPLYSKKDWCATLSYQF